MLPNFWVNFTRWIWRCWRDPLRRLALIAALACAACLGILAGPPYFSTASVPQRWRLDPGLEVQTVTDTEDLRLTLGDAPSQDRETMRLKLKVEFGFIAAYGTLLVALGLIAARSGGWRRFVGVAAALCAVGVARGCDTGSRCAGEFGDPGRVGCSDFRHHRNNARCHSPAERDKMEFGCPLRAIIAESL